LRFIQEKRKLGTGAVLALGNPTTPDNSTLPFTEQEAQTIATLYGTQAWVGPDATESVVWSQANGAEILHLAAHGGYNPTILYSAPSTWREIIKMMASWRFTKSMTLI
jgi:CHAT domain-containing protein